MTGGRRLVGTDYGIGERIRVYRTAEALEIDQMESYNIRRKRVFFDEVQLVTLHTRRGMVLAAVTWSVLALLLGIAAAAAASGPAAMPLYAGAAVTAVLALASLLAPVWTVTVFGKRTRARIRFRLRGGKAHRMYGELCRTIAEAQEEAALRFAAERPKPPPLPPMPPPMPPMPAEEVL